MTREVSERLVELNGRTWRVVAIGNGIAQMVATALRGDERERPVKYESERTLLDAEKAR